MSSSREEMEKKHPVKKRDIEREKREAEKQKEREGKKTASFSPVSSSAASSSSSSSSFSGQRREEELAEALKLPVEQLAKKYKIAKQKYESEESGPYRNVLFKPYNAMAKKLQETEEGKAALSQLEEEKRLARQSGYNPYPALIAQRNADAIQSFDMVPRGSNFSTTGVGSYIPRTNPFTGKSSFVPTPTSDNPTTPQAVMASIPPIPQPEPKKALPQMMEPQINPSLARPMQIQMPNMNEQPFGGNQLLAMLMSGAGGESKYIPISPRQSITDKILAHFGPQMYHPENFPEEEGGFI